MYEEHQSTIVGNLEGDIVEYLQSTTDARSIAYLAGPSDGSESFGVVVWNGARVALRTPADAYDFSFNLAPDGQKLAVSLREADGITVRVLGGATYQTGLGTLHYSGWLDSERYGWEGWTKDSNGRIDGNGIRYFVNGFNTTGRIQFHGVTDGHRSGLAIEENGTVYTAWQDGERSAVQQVPEGEVDRLMGVARIGSRDWSRTYDKVRLPEGGESMRLCGVESAFTFADIGDHHVTATREDGDGATIAYVGQRFPGWSTTVERNIGKLLRKADDHKERKGKDPFWAMPLALLASPYTPFLYPLVKGSARYHVVYARVLDGLIQERVWQKGYRAVWNVQLHEATVAALVVGKAHFRVVIDEVEGPPYDQIWNMQFQPDGSVVYVARRGKVLHRVHVPRA